MRSPPRPSLRNISLLALLLAGGGAAALFAVARPPPALALPFEPNIVQNGGREALEQYVQVSDFFGQTALQADCRHGAPDAMQLALFPAFDAVSYTTLRGARLSESVYPRPGERSSTPPRRRPPARTAATTLPPAALSDLWRNVDNAFLQMPPSHDIDLIDGYTMYLEICKAGRYAFYSRPVPEEFPQDRRLVAVKDALRRLADNAR